MIWHSFSLSLSLSQGRLNDDLSKKAERRRPATSDTNSSNSEEGIDAHISATSFMDIRLERLFPYNTNTMKEQSKYICVSTKKARIPPDKNNVSWTQQIAQRTVSLFHHDVLAILDHRQVILNQEPQ